MDAQQHRNTDKEIIDKWIIFYLECLEEVIRKLEVKYQEYKNRGPYLNSRQKRVIQFIKENQPIKIMDITNRFESESRNTIKKDLQYFMKEGLIEKIGEGRGTIYVFKEEKNKNE